MVMFPTGPSTNVSIWGFFQERLHARLFSRMKAESFIQLEDKILNKEYSWGEVSVLTTPKRNSRLPKFFSVEDGAIEVSRKEFTK